MKAINSVSQLDDALSTPTAGVLEALRSVSGDVVVLGAGGKMGPTLSVMLRRGLDVLGDNSRRVTAVSRFSSAAATNFLRRARVETVSCDLMHRDAIRQLPDAPNVICLVGHKFGTRDAPGLTWVTNTIIPALIAERFAKSRIVALSTGCVYPLVRSDGPGAAEDAALNPPGEYANACVGRERVFEHYSRTNGTPMVLVRLCYAIDLRYGVLLDLAQRVFQQQPVDVSMSATHVIWQGDANARIIQCLTKTAVPPVAVNVTGPQRLQVRALAMRLGDLLGREVCFTGTEAPTAWLWDATRSCEWFGVPETSIDEMLEATANWVLRSGETLNRPTHFEVRDGQF